MKTRTVYLAFILSIYLVFVFSCQKETPSLPVLTTTEVINITDTCALSGGFISSIGNSNIIARGVCWSLAINPIIKDFKTNDGYGGGTFSSKLSGLKFATIYHLRAFATNSVGTAYGNEIIFTTNNAVIPTLITSKIDFVTPTSAHSGGNVIYDGGASISSHGVCWGTDQTPTITNSKTIDSGSTNAFISNLTGLAANTIYFVRAYATNIIGTGYGDVISFKTLPVSYGKVTDIDGNVYNTTTIGTQVWMVENLKTTKFNDGTDINNVTDSIAWRSLGTPAYCWYRHDSGTNKNTYGALYNWYAVNTGKLCPIGWHIPSDVEWKILENYLIDSGYNYDETTTGNKYAKTLACAVGWASSTNIGAVGNTDYIAKINVTGFTALPGGARSFIGSFDYIGSYGSWWSSSDDYAHFAWGRSLSYDSEGMTRFSVTKTLGFSVRCLRD
jgi:uncharacterized protein (TIGR02145 family)